MVGIAADHAVGVGEIVEEAAGWIVLPGKGILQSFQIHPDDGTFGIVVKMGVLHRACADHQAVTFRTSQDIILFLNGAFYGSKGSVLDHAAIGIVGAFPDAGGVPDGGHLSEVVAGELPSWRTVTVGDGDKFPGERSIGVGGGDPSGLGQCLQTVESVVGFGDAGAVCIGLLEFKPRSLVIEPRGGVPVGTAGRISGDVAFVRPEGSQRHHVIGFVVGEAGRLNDGAVLGRLSAAHVVGIANCSPQGVGDAGGMVTAGRVAGGSHLACRIGSFDRTSRKVGFSRRGIASGVRLLENHARGGVGAGL